MFNGSTITATSSFSVFVICSLKVFNEINTNIIISITIIILSYFLQYNYILFDYVLIF